MKIIASHLTGNANVKAAIEGFNKFDLLSSFYVSLANFPGSLLDRIGNYNQFAEIKRRTFKPNLKPYIKTWPWMEIGRLVAPKVGLGRFSKSHSSPFFIERVCSNLDRHVAAQLSSEKRRGADAVYGYEDTVLHSFRRATELGLQCLYDLPIGYWRTAHRLLYDEVKKWPEWETTMTSFQDSDEKNKHKDEELLLANHIFVASTFTANTLKDYPGILAPIKIVPYGFPDVQDIKRNYFSKRDRKLKLLFVGSLSQRKGIADLLWAINALDDRVDLTLVGAKTTEICAPLNLALNKYRWYPSLSHNEVLKLMQESDVLVFPSLFEGFGLVITEAMSQGTPVITTDRTAGPDFIQDNENGWLIKASSQEELKAAIENILINPHLLKQVGVEARETAKKRTWDVYSQELAEAIVSIN